MVVVGVLPLLGMLAYLLLGEVNIGRRRVERLHAVLERMPPFPHPAPRTRRTSRPPFPSATGISFSSATRSAGSNPSVATPRA